MMHQKITLLSLVALLTACGADNHDAEHDHDHDHADHAQSTSAASDHDDERTVTLTPDQVMALDLRTGAPEERSMGGNLQLTGKVMASPVSKARITSPLGAKVVDVLVDEGARVRKGQPLIALSDMAFFRLQEDYLTAQAERELARAELARQRTLTEGNATAAKLLQQAEAQATAVEARTASLAQQLRLLGVDPTGLKPNELQQRFVLRSPIDGRVNGISVHLDEYVQPATVLTEVIDLHHFHVHLNAYERDLAALREGVVFDFRVINLARQVFKGEVFSIGRTFDADERTIPVHAHVEQGSEDLVEGMSVSATIPTTAATSLAVPTSAIASAGNEAFIYLVSGNTADGGQRYDEVAVVTGPSSGGFTAITPLQALPTDARVVVNGVFNLRNMRTASEGHAH